MRRLVILLATWWGVGYSPIAPGTAGTIAAIPLYLFLSALPKVYYIPCILMFALFASVVAARGGRIIGEEDSPRIVIDEVVGFLVTMSFLPLGWIYLFAGFVLFRFFDIVKPPPIRLIEKGVRGGIGVVLDDMVAGVYAQIALRIIYRMVSLVEKMG